MLLLLVFSWLNSHSYTKENNIDHSFEIVKNIQERLIYNNVIKNTRHFYIVLKESIPSKLSSSQMFCAYILTSHLLYTIIMSKCHLGIDKIENIGMFQWVYRFFQSIMMMISLVAILYRLKILLFSQLYIAESLSFQTRPNDGSIWFLSICCFCDTSW